MDPGTRASRLGLVLVASLMPACGGGAGGSGETGDDGGEEAGACEAPVHSPGVTALRRMSSTQYVNTVAALFPSAEMPGLNVLHDQETHGFENFAEQQHASPLLIEQYQKAAIDVTETAMYTAEQWLPCPVDGGGDPLGCGESFLTEFAPRAFRRPVDATTLEPYLAIFESTLSEHGFAVAIQVAIQAMLQSPEFLYFFEFEGTPIESDATIVALDGYAMASRLSYFLWDSMPDAALMAAAAAGELDTIEGVEAQARRMLGEASARRSVVNFHRQWLDYERIDTISLDTETYPDFYWELPEMMKEALSRRVEHVIFDGSGRFEELMTSPEAWVNANLANIYGVEAPPEGQWALRSLDPTQRAGLLTDAGWLSSRAHAVHPSPVQRGVFVLERVLCRPPAPPPGDVDTNPPEDTMGDAQTNRERYQQHVADPTCAACHLSIDGVGFGFENYDAMGSWRDLDNGFDIDASGELLGTDVDGPFNGAVELSNLLAGSDTAMDCMVTQYFRYATGRSENQDDLCQLGELRDGFAENEGDIRELLVSVVTSDVFRHRTVEAN